MRPIRPLFRNNGRLGTPQCHGTFQEWIGDPSRGKDKPPLDVKRGTLRTELVERPDGSGHILVGRPVFDPSSVPGIIARARERKELASQEAETLRGFLVETIKKETYQEWLGSSGLAAHFFREDDWNDQDNHRKFALYALACFVDFFRPGQIDWRTPNPNDMQLVAKLLNIFVESKDADKQRKLLRGLFDLKEKLNGLVVESSTGLSRADQEFIECRRLRLKAEARARWLQQHGFKGFGKSALTKYRENADSMRAQISAWTSEILED